MAVISRKLVILSAARLSAESYKGKLRISPLRPIVSVYVLAVVVRFIGSKCGVLVNLIGIQVEMWRTTDIGYADNA